MTRRMEARPALEVYLSDPGFICIKQENDDFHRSPDEADAVIVLQPDQVPTVIAWLQEVLDQREQLIASGELIPGVGPADEQPEGPAS